MAYQIVQFIATYNLSGIPVNRSFTFSGMQPANSFIIPENENVLIKKIAVDCVYNQQGDLLIQDYSLNLGFLNRDRTILANSPSFTVAPGGFGGIRNYEVQELTFYKENPIQNCNILAGGIFIGTNFSSSGNGNKIVLSNTITPITSNVSFLISLYYEI